MRSASAADRRVGPVATLTVPGGLVVLAGVVALILSGVAGSRWLQLVGASTLALVLLAWLTSPGPSRGVTVGCTRPARAVVGDVVPVVLELRNPGRRASVRLLLRLTGDLAEPVVVDLAPVPGRRSVRARLSTTATRRGVERGLTVELTALDALGLFRRRWSAELVSPLIVHPVLVPVRLPEPRVGDPAEAGAVRGADGDPFALRDWVSGDEGRSVNWRATARRGRLVVTERATAADHTMLVALPDELAADEVETEISRAASRTVAGLRAGRTVHVATPAAPVPRPVRTGLEALDWWAQVDADAITRPGRRAAGSSEARASADSALATTPADRAAATGARRR